jgi:heme-degrading monooxygenase HmoA
LIIALFGGTYLENADLDELNEVTTQLVPSLETTPGFVSYNFFTGEDGRDLAVARFSSRDAVAAWRGNPVHRATWGRMGEFYSDFWVQTAETYRELHRTKDGRRVWEAGKSGGPILTDLFRAGTEQSGLGTAPRKP